MVVTRILGPAFFICLQISSVPIIRPNTLSSMRSVTSNHPDSRTASFSRSSPWGPITMPAISQPRMAGNFSFEISLPAANARKMETSSRSTENKRSIAVFSFFHYRRVRLFFSV